MNRGTALRRLFAAYAAGDDVEFRQVAEEIIVDEEKAHNKALVKDLRSYLDDSRSGRRYINRYKEALKPPVDPENGHPLLEIREPAKDWSEIILHEDTKVIVDRVISEYEQERVLRAHGLEPTRTMLFFGPPGCGKTLCAHILSTTLSLPLIYIRFDSVISSYLGQTSSNLRLIFDFIERGNWVVLFDEFDIIGKTRDSPSEHGEIKRLVNNLLQMIDAFEGKSLLIAATNHEHLLDPAIWRRFEEVVSFPILVDDNLARLLHLFLRVVKKESKLELDTFASQIEGMTPADIAMICKLEMKNMILEGRHEVTTEGLGKAIRSHRQRIDLLRSTRGTHESATS